MCSTRLRSELHASGFLKCVEAASYQPSERVFCRYLAACYIAESPELLQEMMVLKQRFYLFHKFLFAMLNEEQAYQACTLLIHNLQWPETLVDEGFPVDEDGFVTKLAMLIGVLQHERPLCRLLKTCAEQQLPIWATDLFVLECFMESNWAGIQHCVRLFRDGAMCRAEFETIPIPIWLREMILPRLGVLGQRRD
jgi:hypothetical protein